MAILYIDRFCKTIRRTICFGTVFALTACTASLAPSPRLANTPEPSPKGRYDTIFVGQFYDERQNSDMGPTFIGTIRGGYGNPIERMHLQYPAENVVADVLINVLRSHGYVARPLPKSSNETKSTSMPGAMDSSVADPKPLLSGKIISLHAGNNPWAGSRYVEMDIRLCLLDSSLGREVWCDQLRGRDSDKKFAGNSGNSEVMGPWLARLVEDSASTLLGRVQIDKLWNDYLKVLRQSPPGMRVDSHEQRLEQLKGLLDKGLITEGEYNTKRQQIMDSL